MKIVLVVEKAASIGSNFTLNIFYSFSSDLMKQAPHESDTDSIQDYVDGENAGMCYVSHKKTVYLFFFLTNP